ncbi:MAG: metallophosphoesterase [Armatimonadota bacterium]
MAALPTVNWLVAPADREIIARWTRGGAGARHELALPPPADRERFSFLVLGDTGDSEIAGSAYSPQEAVARELVRDCRLPETGGAAEYVLHTGDVVYMAGEKRLYERSFRVPYAPLLTPESTVENLVFRLPFLPVPGNHDYYDFAGWGRLLARAPVLGAGVRALARELFAYSVPRGGSGMGRSYMEAFLDPEPKADPLPYRPGVRTRLPNRYYRFTLGIADFFALDSNTLNSPAPRDAARTREEAKAEQRRLERRARALQRELGRDERALERWKEGYRQHVAATPAVRSRAAAATRAVHEALSRAELVAGTAAGSEPGCGTAAAAIRTARECWGEGAERLETSRRTTAAYEALEQLARSAAAVTEALRELERCQSRLSEGVLRADVSQSWAAVDQALCCWREEVDGRPPEELCARLQRLSQTALDVQRDLARERRLASYRAEDFDAAQLAWLDAALEESERERPGHWRIVYLHHPLYTSIGNHCEHSDVQGVRENLLPLLRGRVHLLLSGHSHAFEWVRAAALSETGLFITGGGGQVTLRRSVLDPRRLARYGERYQALRAAGALETAVAGRGPAAEDGESGMLYHYLRVEVEPERLRVVPIGVRRRAEGYRREEPLPVYHAPFLPPGAPPRERRYLQAVEIRRGAPPAALWSRGG